MAEVAAKQRKHKMSRLEKKNTLIAYSFLAPNFLGFAIFTLVPVVCAILLAFVEWNGGDISNAHFVGLQNFAEIFKADKVASKWANGDYLYFFNRVDLGIALKNTVFYALINVPLTLVCAIALALALNKAKGAVAFRTIFFFPYVASMVAICVCWNFMLMKDGPVNQMIMALGINFNKSWTADSTMAMWAIILVSVWRSMGYYMVIYLAALQGVPRELYEAATVDGANKWQQFRNVTLPQIKPTTFFCTIMLVHWQLQDLRHGRHHDQRRSWTRDEDACHLHLRRGVQQHQVRSGERDCHGAACHRPDCDHHPVRKREEIRQRLRKEEEKP